VCIDAAALLHNREQLVHGLPFSCGCRDCGASLDHGSGIPSGVLFPFAIAWDLYEGQSLFLPIRVAGRFPLFQTVILAARYFFSERSFRFFGAALRFPFDGARFVSCPEIANQAPPCRRFFSDEVIE